MTTLLSPMCDFLSLGTELAGPVPQDFPIPKVYNNVNDEAYCGKNNPNSSMEIPILGLLSWTWIQKEKKEKHIVQSTACDFF